MTLTHVVFWCIRTFVFGTPRAQPRIRYGFGHTSHMEPLGALRAFGHLTAIVGLAANAKDLLALAVATTGLRSLARFRCFTHGIDTQR
jgi:hypothetical protein